MQIALASAEVGGPAQLLPSLKPRSGAHEAERFDDALATLQALAPADRVDPDVLLLTAIIQLETREARFRRPSYAPRCWPATISTPQCIT